MTPNNPTPPPPAHSAGLLTDEERVTLRAVLDDQPVFTGPGTTLNGLAMRGLVEIHKWGLRVTDAGRAALAAEEGPQDDELGRLQAENARLRSEDGPYERTLEAVDTFAHAHFEAVGRPVQRWVNFGEGALALKGELARLRAENERLRRERDRLFAAESHWTSDDWPIALKDVIADALQVLTKGVLPAGSVAAALAAHDREQTP